MEKIPSAVFLCVAETHSTQMLLCNEYKTFFRCFHFLFISIANYVQSVKIDNFWIFFVKEMEISLQICYNMWSELCGWVNFLIFICVFPLLCLTTK